MRHQLRRAPSWHWQKSSNSIVLLDFGTWELTLREALFALLLVGVLATIGFFVSSAIVRNVHSKQLVYRQAAQIENSSGEFKLALDTDVGYAFVEGDMDAVDTVQHEDLDGKWMSIVAKHQKY